MVAEKNVYSLHFYHTHSYIHSLNHSFTLLHSFSAFRHSKTNSMYMLPTECSCSLTICSSGHQPVLFLLHCHTSGGYACLLVNVWSLWLYFFSWHIASCWHNPLSPFLFILTKDYSVTTSMSKSWKVSTIMKLVIASSEVSCVNCWAICCLLPYICDIISVSL